MSAARSRQEKQTKLADILARVGASASPFGLDVRTFVREAAMRYSSTIVNSQIPLQVLGARYCRP